MLLDDKINAAKTAQEKNPPHRDVTVTLDTSLTEERKRLESDRDALEAQRKAAIDAASQSLALAPDTTKIDLAIKSTDRKLAKLDGQEKDTLVTIRIYRHRGDEWFKLKALFPPQVNSSMDRAVGYDVAGLTKQAVQQNGRVVEGKDEFPLSGEQLDGLWPLLAGAGFEALADAVYGLNSVDPLERVERLKNS